MSNKILLWYKCPCGKYHDIAWDTYKILKDQKLDCYCHLISN